MMGYTSASAVRGDALTLLTVDDMAELLRCSRKAVYSRVERRQLPGIVKIGRRVYFDRGVLLDWLHQKSAPSLKE